MEYWKLILLGIVIGSNNLAVSFGLGTLGIRKYWWRIILLFGVFEFTIPLVGIAIGRQFAQFISDYASITGGIILIGFGAILFYRSARQSKSDRKKMAQQVSSWMGTISLAAGLSIDNLIVGFSIGLKNFHPVITASVIAISSVTFAFIGLHVGRFLKATFRVWTERLASFLLVLIGVATLLGWI